ncbi:glucan biosynthesis protein [Stappia sp. F7233]|uniref:Glucans biosynthesis protein G n=1 Tax=Stappia albiluteola TaxID=2758565 RepID=A0A839AH01_9HYPH|nr:glucan biosynthesis protein [Stappia albiluteola]MBA5778027.1 glucan biosynthesis protein [Stappia albiluteola]
MDRRAFLALGSAVIGLVAGRKLMLGLPAQAAEADPGEGVDFSWEHLVERARAKAGEEYSDEPMPLPEVITDLDYDQHRAIRFRPDHALWRDRDTDFTLQAFHPGGLFDQPVAIHEVAGGKATRLRFASSDFEYRPPLDAAAFKDVTMPGVAGFRLHYPLNRTDYRDELIAFLGASYFRALGRGNVYGLSARGLAVDTAAGQQEEFPRFSTFYIERPQPGDRQMKIYAELDSPRVSGAYAFTISPGIETVIDVDARIFMRGDVTRLGIAPLTSMYLFGENDRIGFDDYRPEVHDSDGLAIRRESGERLWRPLMNPSRLALSFIGEVNPQGFGLIQRDRAFDNYLDTEADYERRPSLWIEPVGDWGRGTVMLAEIPSEKEIHDNIVAFWIPEARAKAGSEHSFRYRMTWASDVEGEDVLARVLRTRTGHGGTAASDPDPDHRKFVVEFAGGELENLGVESALEARIETGNADIRHQDLQKLGDSGRWRLVLDVMRADADKPVELRAALVLDGRPLSETWLYQWNGDV